MVAGGSAGHFLSLLGPILSLLDCFQFLIGCLILCTKRFFSPLKLRISHKNSPILLKKKVADPADITDMRRSSC